MKRTSLLATFLAVCLLAAAQSHDFRFFSIPELPVAYQGFAGKVGSHFFMMNRFNPEGLDLYIYDTASLTGSNRLYGFPRQITAIIAKEKSLVFIALTRHSKGVSYHYLELDEKGDSIHRKSTELEGVNSALRTIISPDQKHILFFQHFKAGADSAVVHGTMISADGAVEKNLDYVYKHDKERDDEPELFVDNNGSTHIFVYDKYNNYRISTEFNINTIPFNEEVMITETFSLQKTKLKTASIFQNTASNCTSVGISLK